MKKKCKCNNCEDHGGGDFQPRGAALVRNTRMIRIGEGTFADTAALRAYMERIWGINGVLSLGYWSTVHDDGWIWSPNLQETSIIQTVDNRQI